MNNDSTTIKFSGKISCTSVTRLIDDSEVLATEFLLRPIITDGRYQDYKFDTILSTCNNVSIPLFD